MADWELKALRKRCGALVYDFVDAVWTMSSDDLMSSRKRRRARKSASRFAEQCSTVDLCIAGNTYLGHKASAYQERVRVVPTGLDTARYVYGERCPISNYFQVGWMGSPNSLRYLEQPLDVLKEYVGSLQFSVISSEQYAGPAKEYVFWAKWTRETEISRLQSMDVGLLPLADDEYTRGKCGVRLLQYMACGAIPLASDVGVNREIIEHGVNGFLIEEPKQWGEYAMRLANDSELLEKMRVAARQTVTGRFDVGVVGQGLWSALEEAVG
ncbi:glycosyltransferase family 4 protein [Salidesulfovibrio brasiliensis]